MEEFEDTEYVASEHDRLVSAISKLDKTQHITEPTRNEPTNVNSEFNLIKRSNKLDLNKVVKVLGDTAHHVQVGKKLKKTQDLSKVLPKPLEKPQRERIKRATGYEEAKKKVGRWDPVVARSRTVDYISYPIKHVSHKMQPAEEFLSKLTLKSPLEKQLEEVDPPPVAEEENEDEQLFPMTYQEMVEHRQHLAKMRAQQSYKAAKAKRQSKIKSKKYHRILKKERLKNQLKEFEELQKKDPEEALKKLEALEKARALERHTLRHKNTGKWAKSKLVRAKYDKDVRQELAEQLAVSRGLTQKTQDVESSDDEPDTTENIPDITLSQDPMNPWMLQRSDKSNVDAEFDFERIQKLRDEIDNDDEDSESDIDKSNNDVNKGDEVSGQKSIPDKISQTKQASKQLKKQKSEQPVKKSNKSKKAVATSNWVVETLEESSGNEKSSVEVSTAFESYENNVSSLVERKLKKMRNNIERLEKNKQSGNKKRQKDKEDFDNLEYLKFKKQKVKPIIDEALNETATKNDEDQAQENQNNNLSNILNSAKPQDQAADNITNTNIDPSRFIQVKPKYLKTVIPEGENDLDQLDDDEQVVPKVNIEEVFEEDDVVASFRQEKEDEINKDKPEDIDLSLPGWGSWGGKGVKAPKRKRNRFILKAAPVAPRRDENKGDIIIKEFKDPKLAAHKVKEVPFPFSSVKDYEASIRAPLGNTFIPEKAHKKLIRPSIITKAGAIIEPMDEEELLVKRNRNFKNENVLKMLGQK
ncbi:utp14 protein domain-containing protein [Phthorimaea operculella]|nr:utp14 protein domain-containing protein [Phthorimaea operculella]